MNNQRLGKFAAVATVAVLVAGSVPAAFSQSAPTSIDLTGTVRDFKQGYSGSTPLQGGHPDFERNPGSWGCVFSNWNASKKTCSNPIGQKFSYGLDTNIVGSTIGADKKPVFIGPSVSTTTKEYFDQWYRDVSGVNMSMPLTVSLTDADKDGTYTYTNSSFFPIDNQLFGNQGNSKNYHFTYEIHSRFNYLPGTQSKPRVFKFTGDDDVWVYLNGKKVIDIGGVHSAMDQTVNLDAQAATLGLVPGNIYDFDFFFAERHTTASNFRIDTTVLFLEAD